MASSVVLQGGRDSRPPSAQLRILELEPVRAKRNRGGSISVRRLGLNQLPASASVSINASVLPSPLPFERRPVAAGAEPRDAREPRERAVDGGRSGDELQLYPGRSRPSITPSDQIETPLQLLARARQALAVSNAEQTAEPARTRPGNAEPATLLPRINGGRRASVLAAAPFALTPRQGAEPPRALAKSGDFAPSQIPPSQIPRPRAPTPSAMSEDSSTEPHARELWREPQQQPQQQPQPQLGQPPQPQPQQAQPRTKSRSPPLSRAPGHDLSLVAGAGAGAGADAAADVPTPWRKGLRPQRRRTKAAELNAEPSAAAVAQRSEPARNDAAPERSRLAAPVEPAAAAAGARSAPQTAVGPQQSRTPAVAPSAQPIPPPAGLFGARAPRRAPPSARGEHGHRRSPSPELSQRPQRSQPTSPTPPYRRLDPPPPPPPPHHLQPPPPQQWPQLQPQPAGPPPISLPLDALADWPPATDVSHFAESAHKQLGPDVAGRPLAALADASTLLLRVDMSAPAGVAAAARAVASGLRLATDLKTLAARLDVSQARLWAELLGWHERHGAAYAPAEPPAASAGQPQLVRASAQRGSGSVAIAEQRRRTISHERGHGLLTPFESMAAEQRLMVRSQQGARAADTLVATLRGVSSTESEPVRKRLAALAAAAAEMRRTLRIKIEDDQDLLTASTALLECSVFLSRLIADAAAEQLTPCDKLKQLTETARAPHPA